jgi:hypothetical protein
MSYHQDHPNRSTNERRSDRAEHEGYDDSDDRDPYRNGRSREEVYSRRVPAGKRTYFFDVKTTRSGEDFFVTITESKRIDEDRYEKHKIFLYKEDFGKFVAALHDVVQHIKEERLPNYDFRNLPDLSGLVDEQSAFTDEEEDY